MYKRTLNDMKKSKEMLDSAARMSCFVFYLCSIVGTLYAAIVLIFGNSAQHFLITLVSLGVIIVMLTGVHIVVSLLFAAILRVFRR